MDKDEILAISRTEAKDEGREYVENRGLRVGFFWFVALSLIVMLVDLFYGYGNCIPAIAAFLFAYLASDAYAKFRLTKQRGHLAVLLATGLASMCSLASFIVQTIRLS